ncbi:hypothetical protein [Sulfitobacter dubius]|uniref:hypothetical protein n=1 Tax=Sulfitobacter dubius TaxID=218673 RepID=UPI0022AEC5D2|nr:hypothetical protein [Sulfitobacter dubius]MCZ4368123.1 hypothetical protein [Sulfitobacter dubius]
MIFEVDANQIERLDANQIVELLRRLVNAELLKHSIPLRSGSVPAQITIADGGEDGRVEWSGGPNQTDWLPSRYSVFQSKRGATSPSGLKKETWTKASQKTGNKKILNEALVQTINRSGAYIVVTATAVVGTKRTDRINAIRDGIIEAGHDPSRLTSIDIFDCNKLAAWTNAHPSVGLWLNAILRDVHLGGFQTHEDWSKSPEISEVPYKVSEQPRYLAQGSEIRRWKNDDPSIAEEKDLQEIRQIIFKFFGDRGNALRVFAPSGFGKTRFVYELINKGAEPDDALDANQVVYCNYEDVGDRLLNLAREIADSGSRAILIVDDCPNPIHTRLSEIAHRQGSKCNVITIGVESNAQSMRKNLVVKLNPASDEHIIDIASAVHERAKGRNATLVRELAQGFPRMAVFAARALEDKDFELGSVEALVSRIVWGERGEDASALESLQLVSLFTLVGVEGDVGSELEEVAKFAGRDSQEIFGDLASFAETGVILRQGDYAAVQPLPLAMRLANMWLESKPSGTLAGFFWSLSEDMRLRMVGRLRWVSWSERVREFAQELVREALPDLAFLDTEFGSKLLDRFVHLAPDATMDHLERLLGEKSVDELKSFETGRRHVVWALEKLVFRHQTFISAARLLLLLGAAENENWANNATGQFTSLYQLQLSGTEATPREKLFVLDEGLSHKDQRVQEICLSALDRMLESGHFSRSGGSENIGADEALDDWHPKNYGEIWDYYREALKRLERIALGDQQEHARTALNSIGSHLRSLLHIQPMFSEVQDMIARLLERHPHWTKPLMAVNQWLYFDRNHTPEDYQAKLRTYYDELLPKSDVELLLVYSSGWAIDIHDPDAMYNRDGENDFNYSTNKVEEIVARSPKTAEHFFPVLDAFAVGEFNSGWITVDKISAHADDPHTLLEHLKSLQSLQDDTTKFANFVGSVIRGARRNNRDTALECLNEALAVEVLVPHAVNFIAAAGLDDSLMCRVIELLNEGKIEPRSTDAIAFSETLEGIAPDLIVDLLHIMNQRGSVGAWAAIDFIGRMLYKKSFNREPFVEVVKGIVANPTLFERNNYSNMDWYHWHDIVEKLLDEGFVDDTFAEKLLNFILSVTEVEEYSVQLSFDDYAQEILRKLISIDPEQVWQKFHEHIKNADALREHRLNGLFKARTGNPAGAGVLNDMPMEIIVAWMLDEKKERLPLVLEWIELFPGDEENSEWSANFVDFTDQYIDDLDALDAVTSRITSGSWWGSYTNKIETERARLIQLKDVSSNPLVHRWVDKTVSRFDNSIVAERRRDANRDADFKK